MCAQQRLGLEVLEVVQAFDPREVRVEQHTNHTIELPGRPARLGVAETRCQPLLELLFDQEPAEVIEAAQGRRTLQIETLVENSACLGSSAAVISPHLLGTPLRDVGIASQQSFYHGRSLFEPRQHSLFRDRHPYAVTPAHVHLS